MPEYLVQWEIEVDADTPVDAARRALDMAQRPTTATVFTVRQKIADGSYAEAYRTIDVAEWERFRE
jgi:hypothetical protein